MSSFPSRLPSCLFALSLLLLTMLPDLTAQTIQPTNGIKWPVSGKLRPRSAAEIESSDWSVGGETLDRDFADYDKYKAYLGPLGAKAIRFQAGWAKTERQPGHYDWAWLDRVVNDAVSQKVRPWMDLAYGNLIYQGGGGISLDEGLPSSPEALAAWQKWVRACVARYKDRINEWEVWNEPDHGKTATVAQYLALFVPTAESIRAEQPNSRIYALALAGNVRFAEEFLSALKRDGKLGLVDAITAHGYPLNPNETEKFDDLRNLAAKFSPKIEVRQGETGCPSGKAEAGALRKHEWNENTQAKWTLCRMLAFYAKGYPYSVFTITDFTYVSQKHNGLNPKGLLKTNPDKSVAYAKPSYTAVQNVCAIFDGTWQVAADFPKATQAADHHLKSFAARKKAGDALVIGVWASDQKEGPAEENNAAEMDLDFPQAKFTAPVCVDLRTGLVYDIPAGQWRQAAGGASFKAIPIYDSPVLIAERSTLPLAAPAAP